MKYIFSIGLLFIVHFAHSQISITGTVKDKTTHEVIPGVNVFLPEINIGTVTDNDGSYSLENIPKGYLKLQFSFVGYKTSVEDIYIETKNLEINPLLEVSIIKSEEVIVSAGASSSQHENAIKIETIDADFEHTIPMGSLMNSVTSIPGVDIISKGEGVATPVIRGLSTTNIIVLNNGTRMENFQFSENHPFMVDEAGLERIEVIKGPASLLYGSDALGGVINLIPEKPAPVGTTKGDIQIKYNTNSQGINVGSGIKATHKNFFWGVRGNINSSADYKDGNGALVPNSRFNTKSFNLNSGINKHFGSFRIYYKYNKMDFGMAIPDAFENITSNSRKNNIWYQDLDNHLILFKNKIFINNWIIEPDVNYQLNHRKLKTEPGHEHYINVDMQLETFTYQTKARYNFSGKNRMIFGYQGMFQQNTNTDAPSHVLPDYKLTDNSIFTLYQANWGNKANIQLGIRYDQRNYDVPEQEKSSHSHEEEEHPDEEEHMEAFNKSFGNFSGSAGLTFHTSERLLLRANIASAYRTPHISELMQDGIHGNRYELGNRELKSQRNYELDISTHYHSNQLKYDIALFYNRIINYIFLSPTTDYTNEGYQVYAYQQNNSRLYGIETSIEYFLAKWISAKTTYAHVSGIQDNNNYLPFIPHDKIDISVIATKKRLNSLSELFLRFQTKFAFEQKHPSIFETKTEGYTVANIFAGFKTKLLNTNTKLTFAILNLFDKSYIDHLSTLKGTGYQNMGRSFTIQLKIPIVI